MPRIPKPNPIDYLVSRKFPGMTGREDEIRQEIQANRLISPNVVDSLFERSHLGGPYPSRTSSEVPEAKRLAPREAEAKAYREKLLAQTTDAIEALRQAERAEEIVEEEASRPFNRPSAAADFEHYCRCALWTLDEAVALSFGRNPKLVNWELVQPLVGVSTFARSYERLRDLAKRAMSAGQLFDPVLPGIFLSWAKKLDIPLPDDLVRRAVNSGISLKGWQDLYEAEKKHAEALVEQHEKQRTEWSSKHKDRVEGMRASLDAAKAEIKTLEEQLAARSHSTSSTGKKTDLGTRERESLQLIGLVGAIKSYNYDPSKRNDAATKMHHDLDRLGLAISDDTIRKHLSRAAEQLPAKWREKLSR